MSLEAIQAIGAAVSVLPLGASGKGATEVASFSEWLGQQVSAADSNIKNAEQSVQRLIVGDEQELHRVMLDLERARTSMELVVQIRNRLLEAYQEIARLQV
jgi:flagellar hook-basal body complex protein FliE